MLSAAQTAEIPLFSDALAKGRGPIEAPFIVTYRSAGKVLAFVGADHVSTRENGTIDAIRRAFDATTPSLVIIEGRDDVLFAFRLRSIAQARGYPLLMEARTGRRSRAPWRSDSENR